MDFLLSFLSLFFFFSFFSFFSFFFFFFCFFFFFLFFFFSFFFFFLFFFFFFLFFFLFFFGFFSVFFLFFFSFSEACSLSPFPSYLSLSRRFCVAMLCFFGLVCLVFFLFSSGFLSHVWIISQPVDSSWRVRAGHGHCSVSAGHLPPHVD